MLNITVCFKTFLTSCWKQIFTFKKVIDQLGWCSRKLNSILAISEKCASVKVRYRQNLVTLDMIQQASMRKCVQNSILWYQFCTGNVIDYWYVKILGKMEKIRHGNWVIFADKDYHGLSQEGRAIQPPEHIRVLIHLWIAIKIWECFWATLKWRLLR